VSAKYIILHKAAIQLFYTFEAYKTFLLIFKLELYKPIEHISNYVHVQSCYIPEAAFYTKLMVYFGIFKQLACACNYSLLHIK